MPTAVKFSSQYKELRLIRRTAQERVLPNGNVTVVEPEIVLTFKDHFYTAIEGRNKLQDCYDPDKDAFVLQDELSWMRAHPELDMLFHEMPEDVPDPTPLFKEIALLAASGDHEALMALGREEMETYKREDVLDLIRSSVENMASAAAPPLE